MRPFEGWGVRMVSFEPMFQFRSFQSGPNRTGHFRVEHAAGASYFFLTGRDFDNFHNIGFRFTPVTLTYRIVFAQYNIRLFPDGFTSEQFGADPGTSTLHRGRELVNGFSFGILIPGI